MSYSRKRKPGNSFTDVAKGIIIRTWGRRCYLCGAVGIPLQFDHIIPVSEGGTSDPENGAPACDSCHKLKSERERVRGYRAKQAKAKRPAEPHPSEVETS